MNTLTKKEKTILQNVGKGFDTAPTPKSIELETALYQFADGLGNTVYDAVSENKNAEEVERITKEYTKAWIIKFLNGTHKF